MRAGRCSAEAEKELVESVDIPDGGCHRLVSSSGKLVEGDVTAHNAHRVLVVIFQPLAVDDHVLVTTALSDGVEPLLLVGPVQHLDFPLGQLGEGEPDRLLVGVRIGRHHEGVQDLQVGLLNRVGLGRRDRLVDQVGLTGTASHDSDQKRNDERGAHDFPLA